MPPSLTVPTEQGLYCPSGGFHIDPWGSVEKAIITHAHSDHARAGSRSYLCSASCVPLLKVRLGASVAVESIPYGEARTIGDVRVSLHPAGHVLGSAQVRLEHAGRVTVVSGDYKRAADPTCEPFEPVRCDTFISECTFGLPVFQWPDAGPMWDTLNRWWRANAAGGFTSILYAYSLGKAQRVLAHLDESIGPIGLHGAVMGIDEVYRKAGARLPRAVHAVIENAAMFRGKGFVVAPQSADGTPWMRKFGECRTASASGWMLIRGNRRRQSIDLGLPISDHADFNDLMRTFDETGAERIGLTHGYTAPLQRLLRERGRKTFVIPTRWEGESAEGAEAGAAPVENPGVEPA